MSSLLMKDKGRISGDSPRLESQERFNGSLLPNTIQDAERTVSSGSIHPAFYVVYDQNPFIMNETEMMLIISPEHGYL